MKILIFTEGTIIVHKNAMNHSREDVIKQVKENEESINNHASYIPIGNAAEKIKKWKEQGARILYLTSRKIEKEINDTRNVLKKYNFQEGELFFRKENEEYKDVAERIVPDILIEDDCESIGGIDEMTITHVKPEMKDKIKSIPIKEFDGIDHLPDSINELIGK